LEPLKVVNHGSCLCGAVSFELHLTLRAGREFRSSFMDTYRDYIKREFEERVNANPMYSMRSFARDLSMSPSTLSEVLNEKKGISLKKADLIAQKLKMPDWQAGLFCDLVAVEHGKSAVQREAAKLRISEKAKDNAVKLLSEKAMKSLCSWVELAVLELTYLCDFEPSAKWVSSKIGVDTEKAQAAIDNLIETDLLQVNASGAWLDKSAVFSSTDNIPSQDIQNFHKTVLRKAVQKLDKSLEERTVKTVIFSISKENKNRIDKVLNEAIEKIVSIADQPGQKREDVLCFSTQLFTLLEKTQQTEE